MSRDCERCSVMTVLRSILEARGLKEVQLAKLIDMDPANISRFCREGFDPLVSRSAALLIHTALQRLGVPYHESLRFLLSIGYVDDLVQEMAQKTELWGLDESIAKLQPAAERYNQCDLTQLLRLILKARKHARRAA